MTEITPERSAVLLADASRILRRRLAEWPNTWQPGQLAALLAGAGKGEQFNEWHYRIARAIENGHLTVRTETIDRTKEGKFISSGASIYLAGMAVRVGRQEPDKTITTTLRHVARDAAAAWLHAAGLSPSEIVRAWLGPALEKLGSGDTAPIERRTRAALIKDVQAEWPTIERDLQDASRNGLAVAAKLADGRGWDKGHALEWAKEHGKLTTRDTATWFAPAAMLPTKAKRGSK